MTTETLTLTDFLLARIAEDEEKGLRWGPEMEHLGIRRQWVAECEAKRRIVRLWGQADSVAEAELEGPYAIPDGVEWEHKADALEEALRALAAVYADHPDYREEWRVG